MRNRDPFFTARQLARRWKINTATLRQWRWFNKGPQSQKIGGRTLYKIETIERFENALLRAHTTDCGEHSPKSIPELISDETQKIENPNEDQNKSKK